MNYDRRRVTNPDRKAAGPTACRLLRTPAKRLTALLQSSNLN